jgi:hypothetical protein
LIKTSRFIGSTANSRTSSPSAASGGTIPSPIRLRARRSSGPPPLLDAEHDPDVVLVELVGDRLLFFLDDLACIVDYRNEVAVLEGAKQRRNEFPVLL